MAKPKTKKNWHKNWLAKIWLFWNLCFHFWGAYTPNSKIRNFEIKKKAQKLAKGKCQKRGQVFSARQWSRAAKYETSIPG